jgi:PAS domain S-box-containing protein
MGGRPEWPYTYSSPKVSVLLGYEPQEVIGKTPFDLMPPEEAKRVAGIFNGFLSRQEPFDVIENTNIHKNGSLVVMETSGVPIFNDEGEFLGYRGIDRDITKRKKTEEERKNLQSQLQQAQKMEAVATLAGGIAHQFNNALSGITVNIDLLELDLPDDENIKGYTEQMRHAAHRMTQLTSQLLAYARGGKYQAQIISPSVFVRDALPLIKHRLHPGVDVDTILPRNILPVKADIVQMQMVLSAVLQNASEAIEGEGRIQISTKNEAIDALSADDPPGFKPGSYVSITVTDEGKGMDEETRNRIFEPFFTQKIQGRGLGMAAAYGIVKNHDGYIFIDSELDKGTMVRILLPAIEEDRKKTVKPPVKPVKGSGIIGEDEESPGKRSLI